MKLPSSTQDVMIQALRSIAEICLDLYPHVDEHTIGKLNSVTKLIGRLKIFTEEDEQPQIPVYSDVNALAAEMIRRRAADEKAWKELLDEESTPGQ